MGQLRTSLVLTLLCVGMAYGMGDRNEVPTEFQWLDNDDTQTALSKLRNNWRIENIEGPYTDGILVVPGRRDTLLRKAARNNHIAIVDYLHHHLNISLDKDKHLSKDAPLDAAVDAGHFEMVRHLVDDLGASVDAITLGEDTPQHKAARNGYISILKVLVDRSQSRLDARSLATHLSPVQEAVYNGHLDIVKYYLEDKKLSPYLPKETLLHDAARAGSLHIVRYLVETYGMPADYQPKDNKNRYCLSPLMCVGNGEQSIMKYLIEECRVPIDSTAEMGRMTALSEAVKDVRDQSGVHEYCDNVMFLLSCGADPYIRLKIYLDGGTCNIFEFSEKLYKDRKKEWEDDALFMPKEWYQQRFDSICPIHRFINDRLVALYNGNTDYVCHCSSDKICDVYTIVALGQKCFNTVWDLISRASNPVKRSGYALYHAYALQRYAFHHDVKDFIDNITDPMSHAYALFYAIADKMRVQEYRPSVAQAVIDTASKKTEENMPHALRSELRRDQVSESVLKYVIYQYPRYMKQSGMDISTGNTLLHDFVYAKQLTHCFPEYVCQCIDDYTAVSRTNNNNKHTPAKLSQEVANMPFGNYHTIARIPVSYRKETPPSQRKVIPSVIASHIIGYIGHDNMYSVNFHGGT